MKKKGYTRRDFLKKSATVAGAAAAGTFLGGKAPLFVKNAFASDPLRVIGLEIGPIPPIMKKASEDLGFEVIGKSMSNEELNLMGTTAPDEFDVAEEYQDALAVTWPAKGYQPLDTKRIPSWDKLSKLVREGHIVENEFCDEYGIMGAGHSPRRMLYVDSNGEMVYAKDPSKTTQYVVGAPTFSNADSLGYNASQVSPVRTWGRLLDPELKGQVALCTFPPVGIVDMGMAMRSVGLADFEDIGDPSKKEIDVVVDYLIEKKKEGHFRAFWETYNQSVQLMTSGEVALESMWYPAVNAVRAAGIDCHYGDMYHEGYRGFYAINMISSSVKGKKLEQAYKYIEWCYSGYYGAAMIRQGYYMERPDTFKNFITPEELAYWHEGKPATVEIKDFWDGIVARPGEVRDGGSWEQRMGRIAAWNSYPAEVTYLIKAWNKMKAA
jgi:putative spermidine/putrescine transport system substrate-binding protein